MTELRIHVDIAGRTLSAGTAYVSVRRGRVSTTFTYDAAYLSNPAGYDLEPGLLRRSGQHYVDGLPGSFAETVPRIGGDATSSTADAGQPNETWRSAYRGSRTPTTSSVSAT